MATRPQNPPYSPPPKETNYDDPLISGGGDYHEYTRYSPSILIISDNSARLSQLAQWLESKGCQVKGININSNTLASVSQKYFDLMVVDLDSFERIGSKNVVRAAGVACVPTVGTAPTERVGKVGASAGSSL